MFKTRRIFSETYFFNEVFETSLNLIYIFDREENTLIAGKTLGIFYRGVYDLHDDEITEIFINLGGLESVFCLFFRSDDKIRTEIVDFFIFNLRDKYYRFFFENLIFLEQLRGVFDSESTWHV